MDLECPSRQSPERNCGESHQISKTSVRRYVQNPSSQRGAVENGFCLAEVTCLINQRPLYPSSNGIWESPPFTPNDLFIGNHFPPPMPEVESKVNPGHLMEGTEK